MWTANWEKVFPIIALCLLASWIKIMDFPSPLINLAQVTVARKLLKFRSYGRRVILVGQWHFFTPELCRLSYSGQFAVEPSVLHPLVSHSRNGLIKVSVRQTQGMSIFRIILSGFFMAVDSDTTKRRCTENDARLKEQKDSHHSLLEGINDGQYVWGEPSLYW